MKIIGVTGGIGSGKSLACKILEEYGAFILNTDQIAKDQMKKGGISYRNVVKYFGEGILLDDGEIDRKKLGEIIFTNKENLKKLNQLTHPPVVDYIKKTIKQLDDNQEYEYIALETALAIESGLDKICHEVWYVYAPEDVRRQRLIDSRNMDNKKISNVFDKQSKDEEFRKRFNKVLVNDGNIEDLRREVEKLLLGKQG